ncbi:MAG: hypothetical protein A2W91_10175 [Bacteroidetes bacterium GWF2_38_335]|nr:MAG: hypothetical protein A2W91_10175 [Bacteroidetes bacterium GWF2_38_335]HBS88009.1 hypothetical protein [Bacteroidales bacterium]
MNPTTYDFRNKNILIADDEAINHILFKEILSDSGANLTFVFNGREAIDKVRKDHSVDIVLMDLKMPGINGFDASLQIKEIKNIPIIIQTAYAKDFRRDEFMKAMVDDYIPKPIKSEKLLEAIDKQINTKFYKNNIKSTGKNGKQSNTKKTSHFAPKTAIDSISVLIKKIFVPRIRITTISNLLE